MFMKPILLRDAQLEDILHPIHRIIDPLIKMVDTILKELDRMKTSLSDTITGHIKITENGFLGIGSKLDWIPSLVFSFFVNQIGEIFDETAKKLEELYGS